MKKILIIEVVEDDKLLGEALHKKFEKEESFTTIVAKDGEEGLSL